MPGRGGNQVTKYFEQAVFADKKRVRRRDRVRAKVGLGLGQVVLAFLAKVIPSQADEEQALWSVPEVEVLRRAAE